MVDSTLTLDRATYSSVSELCEQFVHSSSAVCALLVGQDGVLLHSTGAMTGLDAESLSALAAGTFASTREMAGLIGEEDFAVILQQGRQRHLQLFRVGDCALLVAVFDDRTTAGMVRLHGQRVARRLVQLLTKTEAGARSETDAGGEWPEAPSEEAADLAREGRGHDLVEFASSTQTREEQLRADLRLRTITVAVALLAAAVAALGPLLRP